MTDRDTMLRLAECEKKYEALLRGSTKRYDRLLASMSELQQLAQAVCDETDNNLDTKKSPHKFGAPYGALANLRICLNSHRGLRPPPGALPTPASAPDGEPGRIASLSIEREVWFQDARQARGLLQEWVALEGSAWFTMRYDNEKAELLRRTKAYVAAKESDNS